jgi:hypothetical protein
MRVKIYESIYNYEIFRYNKNIVSLNKEYNIAIEQLKMAEKTRIKFIKASIDKYKIYWEKYIKNIKDYLYIIENFVSQNVCEKDEKFWMNEITRYKKNDSDRIPQEQFLSFKEYMEKNKENVKNNKDLFKYDKNKIITLNKFDEKEEKNFINNIIDDLIKLILFFSNSFIC